MDRYLEVQDLHKTYEGTVQALQGVSLSVRKGTVHAVIGENGAGKSTLAKVIGGVVQFDEGQIVFKGAPYRPSSPREANALGIGMVHQHFMLFPSLTVAENIVLGSEPVYGPRLDIEGAELEVQALVKKYGIQVDPRARVRDLSVGEQQRVEILKALYLNVELVIFDEPTAVLTPQEIEKLFKGIRRLKSEGHTVIIIAHKLEEILAISDEVTVLRRGRLVGSRLTEGASSEDLVRMMVGSDVDIHKERSFGRPGGPPRLQVKDLTLEGPHGRALLENVSFTVHSGEILGVAGVEGNGQAELEQVLGGLLTPTRGTVELAGQDITRASPLERRRLGMANIPSDRLAWGCSPQASVFENSISQLHREHRTGGVLNIGALKRKAQEIFTTFDVRTPGMAVQVGALSGGNLQKLILGRELTAGRRRGAGGSGGGRSGGADDAREQVPEAIVVATPTRGIDVRGVVFIHDLLCEYRDAGTAIVLISTDLDELLALSDRLVVLYKGTAAAVLPGAGQTGKEELGRYMLQGAAAERASA